MPVNDAGVPGALAGLTEPPAGQQGVPVDTGLALTFDAAPTLGQGVIQIIRTSDGSVVDDVSTGADTDVLGPATGTSGGRTRRVNTRPVLVRGNTVFIDLHSHVLEYGVEYAVSIPSGVISGTLAGQPFEGFGFQSTFVESAARDAGWRFTTRSTAPTGADVTVDDDGLASDFRSIQGALDHIMETVAANTPATIRVNDGFNHELLFERGKNDLTIVGESRDGSVRARQERPDHRRRVTGRRRGGVRELRGVQRWHRLQRGWSGCWGERRPRHLSGREL